MATTSPDNLRTPNPGDPYNLVPDLATLAQDVQNALNTKESNVFKGTAAQRAAFLSTAVQGMLWQDTDSIKMLWRRDVSAWVPAVWRWAGTTAQMNAFTQAPNGFEWFNTTDNSTYLKLSGAWRGGVASLSITSPWTSDATYPPAAMRQGNLVQLTGRAAGFALGQIGIIPVGFRPRQLEFFVTERGDASSSLRGTISTAGVISATSITGASAPAGSSLNSISYIAAL